MDGGQSDGHVSIPAPKATTASAPQGARRSLARGPRVSLTRNPLQSMRRFAAWQRREDAPAGPDVWAVAGGKGGVGKSVIASNLALAVARRGLTCLLIDADLGAGNQHTLFGIDHPKRTLDEFIQGDAGSLDDVASPTRFAGLSLIFAQCDALGSANPKHAQKAKLLRHIAKAKSDVVLIDLGAGTGFNTLDLFLAARVQLVVATTEPTSIQNAYGFMKCAVSRGLGHDPVISCTPRLIVNQATEVDAGRVFQALLAVTDRFLEATPSQGGSVRRDPSVVTAVAQGAPVSALSPSSPSSRDIDVITAALLSERFRAPEERGEDAALARGMNEELKLGDKLYHIQTEDLGGEKAQIRTQVFERGRVVFTKVSPYGTRLKDGRILTRQQQVEFQHRVVGKAIREQRLA